MNLRILICGVTLLLLPSLASAISSREQELRGELEDAYTALTALQNAINKEDKDWNQTEELRKSAIAEVKQIQSTALRVMKKYTEVLEENKKLEETKHVWMWRFFGVLAVFGLYTYAKIQFPFLKAILP